MQGGSGKIDAACWVHCRGALQRTLYLAIFLPSQGTVPPFDSAVQTGATCKQLQAIDQSLRTCTWVPAPLRQTPRSRSQTARPHICTQSFQRKVS